MYLETYTIEIANTSCIGLISMKAPIRTRVIDPCIVPKNYFHSHDMMTTSLNEMINISFVKKIQEGKKDGQTEITKEYY